METKKRKNLDEYLDLNYSIRVDADPDGGFVITVPDLPGCMTQVESAAEIGQAAEEARRLWIMTEYEDGADIPLPSYPGEYSGKFNLRLPKSLHRRLAESAELEGVSLNQLVVSLLSGGVTKSLTSARLRGVSAARERRSSEEGLGRVRSVRSPAAAGHEFVPSQANHGRNSAITRGPETSGPVANRRWPFGSRGSRSDEHE